MNSWQLSVASQLIACLVLYAFWSRLCMIPVLGGWGLGRKQPVVGLLTSIVILLVAQSTALMLLQGWYRLIALPALFVALYLDGWRANHRAQAAIASQLVNEGVERSQANREAKDIVRNASSAAFRGPQEGR